jgi:hypothetical protein
MQNVLEGDAVRSAHQKPDVKPVTVTSDLGEGFLPTVVPVSVFAMVLNRAVKIDADPNLILSYLQYMADECGVADDPLGRALVEELAALKLVVGNLHSQTMNCKKATELVAINAAACAAAAEMRRIVMALKELQKSSGSARKSDGKGMSQAGNKTAVDKQDAQTV